MDESRKTNLKAYDSTAEEFYERTKNLDNHEIIAREEFSSLVKGRIIDIACGPGRDAHYFTEKGFDVTGIDFSPKMIEKARTVCPKAKFMVMDFSALMFPDASFNGAWFSAGLLAVPKKDALHVLKGINRILRPNGIMYLSVKEGIGEGIEKDERYNVNKFYAYYYESELKGLLVKAGFEIIKAEMPNYKNPYHKHQWIAFLAKKI